VSYACRTKDVEPKKFYYIGNSRLNSFDGKFKDDEEALILSSINDDQLLVSITDYELSTGLPSFLRLDFSRSPRDLLEFEASKLEKKIPTELAKKMSLADKYKDCMVSGFVSCYRGGKYFLLGDGESEELGKVFLPQSIANDQKLGLHIRVNFGIEYDADHDNFRVTWAQRY